MRSVPFRIDLTANTPQVVKTTIHNLKVLGFSIVGYVTASHQASTSLAILFLDSGALDNFTAATAVQGVASTIMAGSTNNPQLILPHGVYVQDLTIFVDGPTTQTIYGNVFVEG